jgi:hypothetical protein
MSIRQIDIGLHQLPFVALSLLACVVALLAFAAPLIGDVGSYGKFLELLWKEMLHYTRQFSLCSSFIFVGSGALYVSYTLSSLFLGPAIVHRSTPPPPYIVFDLLLVLVYFPILVNYFFVE